MPTVPYAKQTWTDGASSASAARLTVLENGIYEVSLSPSVSAYHNAAQAVTTGVNFALALNSERWDTCAATADTMHDTVTNNSRLTCRYAGKYIITGTIEWAGSSSGASRDIMIRLNGSTFIAKHRGVPISTAVVMQSVSRIYDLAVNDYVELVVLHDVGSNLNVNSAGNYSPEFSMTRIG